MDVITKPYKFIWFGDIDAPKPYEFIGSGGFYFANTSISHFTSLGSSSKHEFTAPGEGFRVEMARDLKIRRNASNKS